MNEPPWFITQTLQTRYGTDAVAQHLLEGSAPAEAAAQVEEEFNKRLSQQQ
ncbi:hypothetical protein [Streptomyces sp. NPDC000983]|uniref:hypothetical protein n=1 Tax=Streptomyces sp. NPDC000983 TaxID=3154373 RepID=UPI00332AE89E